MLSARSHQMTKNLQNIQSRPRLVSRLTILCARCFGVCIKTIVVDSAFAVYIRIYQICSTLAQCYDHSFRLCLLCISSVFVLCLLLSIYYYKMNQIPAFWDKIENSLCFDFGEIKEIKEILTFFRYTTIESIIKFDKHRAIATLELEFMNRKAEIVKWYPHLENFTFASGVYSILGDLATKIKKSYIHEKENLDFESISAKVLMDAKKVIEFSGSNSFCMSVWCETH